MEYKLSPSDLTFLYEGCKRCFVLKVKHGISQPSIPIPGVFSTIASLQKTYYSGKRTEEFCQGLPPGIVKFGEKKVRSITISFDGLESTCVIIGRFDVVVEFDDGSYGVLDFKTGDPNDEKTEIYSRQLHAYALALENPAEGALELRPVSRLGLLYFTPDACEYKAAGRQILSGQITWVEIQKDEEKFLDFLKEVVLLLDGALPEPAENCEWCRYLQDAAKLPSCPQCGGPMQLKRGRKGEFWSCLKYPNCRGTRER